MWVLWRALAALVAGHGNCGVRRGDFGGCHPIWPCAGAGFDFEYVAFVGVDHLVCHRRFVDAPA